MTIGQRRPLLQAETGRLMLPDRRQKRKWNVTSAAGRRSWHFTHGKKYPLAIFSFVRDAEGDGATSPSSSSRNGSIDTSRSSPEAQMEHYFCSWKAKLGTLHTEKKPTCFRFLPSFMA